MAIKILILLSTLFFISCGSDNEYASVTTFSDSDYEFMPTNYKDEKTRTFTSNLDNEITIAIVGYNFMFFLSL